MNAISNTGAWVSAHAQASAPTVLADGGFDFNKVKPDGSAVPKSDLFYSIVNGTLFLLVVASILTLLAGAIAYGAGPIFGAHILSDRGKSMMWKACLMALIAGSGSSVILFLMSK